MRPQAPPSLPSVQIHAYGPTPLPAARVSGADPLAAITTTGLGEPMFLPVAGGAEVSRSRSRRQRHTYQELELGHHRCLICVRSTWERQIGQYCTWQRIESALKDMETILKQANQAEEAIEAIRSFRDCCPNEAQESLDNILLGLYKVSRACKFMYVS
uniref:Uncharacterized protein n=3 Tax=Aegilops tauschii subsp. strangulata TaxID=200361 RepID=A0A453EN86_AEGTS